LRESEAAQATGEAFRKAGRADEALFHFKRARDLDPANGLAVRGLVALLIERRELGPALEALKKGLAANPFDLRLIAEKRRLGLALYAAGLWESAEALLRSALEFEPWDTALRAAYERARRPDYLGQDVQDTRTGKVLRRYAAREGDAYIYVIDIAGTCNLRCPTCPVGNSPLGERPTGLMDFGLFEKIIAKIRRESPSLRPIVNLYNWGEPLLHPDLPKMIALLRREGIKSSLSSNLNIKRGLEDVIAADPDELKISISGFTDETYGKTHVRGDLDLLKTNMRAVRTFIDKYRASTRVWAGHHIYKSNQHQAPAVRQFCQELGFAYHPIAAFYMPLERLMDHLQGKANPNDQGIVDDLLYHPAERQKAAAAGHGGSFDCELRFNQTVINHDGSVALCCTVYDKENMLDTQFLEADFAEIERRKYAHPFCETCFKQHLEYAPFHLEACETA
jgi:MoaA/NifB/PqqE/SkfB family radical SAM enzyme